MLQLDPYAQRFAAVLFNVYPDWMQFSQSEDQKLLVKVPVPIQIPTPQHEDDFLWIDAEPQEGVTVAYNTYHTHFDRFDGEIESEAFAQAVEFIQTIVQEKICIVTVMDGEKWRGSTIIEAGEGPDLSGFTNFNTVYVRSWNGTWNRLLSI